MKYTHGSITKSLLIVFVVVGFVVGGVVLARPGAEMPSDNNAGVVVESTIDSSLLLEETSDEPTEDIDSSNEASSDDMIVAEPEPIPVLHLETPDQVKALYMTSWVAGSTRIAKHKNLLELLHDSEVNAVVIDIKDDTGKVAFHVDHPIVNQYGSTENRIPHIRALVRQLNEEGIYVIGRISVFQDPYMAENFPDLAVRRNSDGGVWKDKKGLSFLDVKNETVWEYITALAVASYDIGFDEINFDYVRYPSDGDISNINYNLAEGEQRADNLEKFFAHLDTELRQKKGIPTSADIFGMTTTNTDDLGIGQVLEKTAPYFDYVAPMVYPSHYPNGWNGYANPASRPYDVVYTAMSSAVERMEVMGYSGDNLRTWVQDFSIHGVTYTADMVRAQIQASYDAGVDSWMIWDPANTYTHGVYEDKETNTMTNYEESSI